MAKAICLRKRLLLMIVTPQVTLAFLCRSPFLLYISPTSTTRIMC